MIRYGLWGPPLFCVPVVGLMVAHGEFGQVCPLAKWGGVGGIDH